MPIDEILDGRLQIVHNHKRITNAIEGKALLNTTYGYIMEKLQEKVKELRRKKGWAQEDMAREIGVSLSTVQRWERQGGRPSRLARRELERLFEEAGIEWNVNPGRW